MAEFMRRLTELTRETGIAIKGCGCCDSPYLVDVSDNLDSSYVIRDPDVAPFGWITWADKKDA